MRTGERMSGNGNTVDIVAIQICHPHNLEMATNLTGNESETLPVSWGLKKTAFHMTGTSVRRHTAVPTLL